MRRALLDVNVLLALLDLEHPFHERARDWVLANRDAGGASCPITQNGYLRIVSSPKYSMPASPADAIRRLGKAVHNQYHRFWPDDISLADVGTVAAERVLGTKQISDIYLLALAVKNAGQLITFDRGVPLSAVPGATEDHIVYL